MPILIANEEVKNVQIHHVQHASAIVGVNCLDLKSPKSKKLCSRGSLTYNIAVTLIVLPLYSSPLRVGSSPRIPPHLSLGVIVLRQVHAHRDLKQVGTSTDRVVSIAVVLAFAMEANIVVWRDIESVENRVIGDWIELGRDVDDTADVRDRATKAENSVKYFN